MHSNIPYGFINDSTEVFLPDNGKYPATRYQFNSIMIDKQNNKWLNVVNGVYKFDGKDWTLFNSDNISVFADFTPYLSVCDTNGLVYLFGNVTKTGVYGRPAVILYKDGTWTSYFLPFESYTVQIDPATNVLYILSRNTGTSGINRIYKYNGTGNFYDTTNYTVFDFGAYNTKDFTVFNNTLFVSFNQAEYGYPVDSNNFGIIVQSVNGNRTVTNFPDSTLKLEFHGLTTYDGSNVVMLGMGNWWDMLNSFTQPDLYYFDGINWSVVPIPKNYIAPIKYSKDGTIWMGGDGLTKFSHNVFTHYNISSMFTYAGSVSDFAIDEKNIIWIASWNTGLIEYKAQ